MSEMVRGAGSSWINGPGRIVVSLRDVNLRVLFQQDPVR